MTKTRLSIFILIGFLLGLAAPAWAGYQEGIDAYERGDYDTALKEFRPLAEQGHAWSQCNLGWLYGEGKGVPQDYQEALRWYRLATDQGYAYAQNNLGYMYENGEGMPQDYQKALRWYRLAADQGEATAQNHLGEMYHDGKGVQKDSIQAYMWWTLSAEQGFKLAKESLETVEKKVTPAQLAEAQRLAREWKAKPK